MSLPPFLRARLRGTLWYILTPLYLVSTTTILLNNNYAEVTRITGSSMSPTLSPLYATSPDNPTDSILWSKWQPTRSLRRGDVVCFSAPHNQGTAVKRVVALGGDTVLLDPRRRPRDAENGRVNEAARRWDVWRGRVVVPEGHVWVEGDNWRSTRDSNDYGPISKSLVQGKAWVLWAPWGQFGTRPWEGYDIRTRVIKGEEIVRKRTDEGVATWEPHG